MYEHSRPAQEVRVGAARTHFFDNGTAPSESLPTPILRSWARCRSTGLDASVPVEFEPIGRARQVECRERHEELRRIAEPAAKRLASAVVAARHMVLVTDGDGIIVAALGDSSRVSRTLQLLARQGVDVSERAIGTNSMGTALRERAPVAVTGAEHYCQTNGRLVCMAAPLFLPDGRIAGTIDVTGDYDDSAPPLAAPVIGAARMIEIGLFLATQRDKLLLQFAWDTTDLASKDAGWLAFDDSGQLTGATSTARHLLGLGDGAIHAQFESLFHQSFCMPLRALSKDAPFQLRTPHGFVFAARMLRAGMDEAALAAEARQLPSPINGRGSREEHAACAATGAATTLRQMSAHHAREMVEVEGGNKLRAALRLGISRSTLYRLLLGAGENY